ncbi:MAG: hypothetical protein OHK0017_05890 [Patescibacteria group bacterium]
MSDNKEENMVVEDTAAKKEIAKVEEKEATVVKKTTKAEPLNEAELKAVSGFIFWGRFAAVLGFIGAGFMILGGLPTLLYLGLGIIYWINAGITIFVSAMLWTLTNLVDEISRKDGKDFKDHAFRIISALRNMYKASVIGTISMVVFVILWIIVIVIFASSVFSSFSRSASGDNFNYGEGTYKLK